MRRFPVLLILAGFIAALNTVAAQKPAQKGQGGELVLASKGKGQFVKIAGGKLHLKYKDPKGKDQTIQLAMLPSEQIKVRIGTPPVAFDTKGRLKKYSKEELAELKGDDPKEWGYTASLNDLKPDQVIGVFLYRPKGAARNAELVVGKVYILQ